MFSREDRPVLPDDDHPVLTFGLGRSYGDSCLNDGGHLIDTSHLDRFISFDSGSGLFACEAGVSLAGILAFILPHGWFLPVTPGTKFVTVAGAVANDVHGKNHHRAGTFGCHVTRFELLRSDGSRYLCSKDENPELFRATIGGLGLTGVILWVEFKLRRIASAFITSHKKPFGSLAEFAALSASADKTDEFTVSWLDCLSPKGRGVFIAGNHVEESDGSLSKPVPQPKLSVPLDAPGFLLNRLSVAAFNQLYYSMNRGGSNNTKTHFDPFFYPLDAIGKWNRMYGSRGFLQYQFVVPDEHEDLVYEILKRLVKSGRASFLAVLKKFGGIASPGMLSFPRPGTTLALDLPYRPDTVRLLEELDAMLRTCPGTRIYPAKDARMSPETFTHSFPQWREFKRYIDPRFSSSFWRRVTSEVQA
jgi:FAD/FMN-containing dehydrogenase